MENNNTDVQLISQIMSELPHRPRMPEPMREGLVGMVDDVFNGHIDPSELGDFNKSPEYLRLIV